MLTKNILQTIHIWCSCQRWLTRVPLGGAMVLASLLFCAATAHASLVRVDSGYLLNPGLTVSTVAFFDDALKGGPGSGGAIIQVDEYFLTFSDRGPSTGVEADITSPGFGVTARFNNGSFVRFLGSGGLSGLGLGSLTNFALEIPSSRLVVNVLFTGQRNYALESQSGLIPLTQSPVPVPAAVWLFGTALIGLVGFGRRKTRIAA